MLGTLLRAGADLPASVDHAMPGEVAAGRQRVKRVAHLACRTGDAGEPCHVAVGADPSRWNPTDDSIDRLVDRARGFRGALAPASLVGGPVSGRARPEIVVRSGPIGRERAPGHPGPTAASELASSLLRRCADWRDFKEEVSLTEIASHLTNPTQRPTKPPCAIGGRQGSIIERQPNVLKPPLSISSQYPRSPPGGSSSLTGTQIRRFGVSIRHGVDSTQGACLTRQAPFVHLGPFIGGRCRGRPKSRAHARSGLRGLPSRAANRPVRQGTTPPHRSRSAPGGPCRGHGP